MSPFLLLVIVGVTVAQPHPGDGDGVSCYTCGGRGPDHKFPECLDHAVNCHGDEICQIRYGGRETHIACERKADCEHVVNDADRQCSSGGASVRGGECQICCSDETCLTDSVSIFNGDGAGGAVVNHLHVRCPEVCDLDNMAACVSTGHVCNDQEYCKITVDENNNRMHGSCDDKEEIQHCKDQAADHHCDPHGHNCVKNCCEDDTCVAGSFGGASGTDTGSASACEDQLADGQCSALDSSRHLCGDHLAVRVCPKTCNLCNVLPADSCKDTVVNNGCAALVDSEDICSNPLAMYLCPVTCNKCDALLDQAIKDALNAGSQSSTAPPAVTPTDNSLSCAAMAILPCSDLVNMCLQANCPTVCDKCSATTMPPAPASTATIIPDITMNAVSTQGPTAAAGITAQPAPSGTPAVADTTVLAVLTGTTAPPAPSGTPAVADTTVFAVPAGTTAPPAPSGTPAVADTTVSAVPTGTAAPASTAAAAAASTAGPSAPLPSATAAPPASSGIPAAMTMDTTAPPAADSATTTCEDNIASQIAGVQCADVDDVCTSPLLAPYCPKYCGAC